VSDLPSLHLIAHIVRGEPAFDIAMPFDSCGEKSWIIPTSGHLAHPYWHMALSAIGMALGSREYFAAIAAAAPAGCLDHYHCNRKVAPAAPSATSLDDLGLGD
jgi:hypothetical protein